MIIEGYLLTMSGRKSTTVRGSTNLHYHKQMNSFAARTLHGFTLIELMIVLAVASILALVTYPSYMDSVRKSRRQSAIAVLKSVQLAQERYRATQPTYGNLSALISTYGVVGLSGTTSDGYYTLTITSPTATGYTATATAVAGTSQVSDTAGGASCASLSVNQDQPMDTTPSQALNLQKACWGR